MVVVALLVVLGALPGAPAGAQGEPQLPTLPNSAEISLKVERDGALSVVEAVSVPSEATMTRRVPLRTAAPRDRDRIIGIRDVVIEGAGNSELTDDEFTIRLKGGTSIVRYTVDGAVAEADGLLRVGWQVAGGWDTGLELVRAAFAAPAIPNAVTCHAGPEGSRVHCGTAQIGHSGLTRFSQQNLPAGQRMEISVELPGGTVPANARLEPSKTFAGAFVLTAPVGWAWGGFALALIAGAVALGVLRRRDRRPGGALPVQLLTGKDEQAAFTSPEGVLPGQVGFVLSGRTDAVDLAATVVDLAVRNYLWVSEEAGELTDWRLVRRNPPDEQLTAFEHAVFDLLLPDGRESIRLSEIQSAGIGVDAVRGALRDSVVERRWYSRGPGRLTRAGLRICFYGLFLTVLLALTVGYAQLGLIVVAAGAVLAVAARRLPVRTGAGIALHRRLLGVREAVLATKPAAVPKLEREVLLWRALPYALALGEQETWIAGFAAIKGPPKIYWYGRETADEAEIARVSDFTAALVGTFAATRQGRRLKP
ncbi:DUF2207 family protein [Amycolatopsis regifaucium]|uniref:DUF2207 domain-containing protein n=1 Tax=Amycolatopsis regifaucium TaxID=546365 RepID=A0A154MD10_9PSEU|nr:DUF2207 domain-containing protein [Amycolatopsis regifaucium]KZB82435.1 hypothetical protein AVL48_11060 [Amycolatopsis regifaucium]OKA03272.1 hypothetical protein ATP06_0237185 [Amycolatopsis regifaucium]SFJ44332.1 Predicted membrane protein [Amycolatopsis regifaucium]